MANKQQTIIDKFDCQNLLPVYLIHGTENYYIDLLTQKIIDNAIPESEKSFNEYILYGKDLSLGDILNYVKKFPMMGDRQLVLVKEAHSITDLNNKELLSLLENYIKKPLTSTILVLSFGKPQDERKTWIKAISAKGQIYNFKKMNDYEIPDFILSHCNEKQRKISPKAIQILNEHVGNNLQAIHNEIEKISLNLTENQTIDAESIEKYVGISKDFNVFELQKALLDKNPLQSYQIVNYFSENSKEHPIQSNIIIIYNFFSKVLLINGLNGLSDAELAKSLGVNPYFLKDYKKAQNVFSIAHLLRIINTIRMVDQKSKGINAGNTTESELYKELIFNILH